MSLTRPVGRRLAAVLVLVVIPLLCTGTSLYLRAMDGRGDFEDIYSESAAALRSLRLDEASLGLYPPSARPLLMVQALLPLKVAVVTWSVIYAGLYLLCCWAVARWLVPVEDRRRPAAMLLVWAFMLPWIWSDLAVGNVTSMLVASVVLSYILVKRGREIAGSFLLSLGIILKFLPALMLVFYAMRRRYRVVLMTLAFSLVLGVLPGLMLFGPRNYVDGWRLWREKVATPRSPATMIFGRRRWSYQNQAWSAVLVRMFADVNAGHTRQPFKVTLAELPSGWIFALWCAVAAVPVAGIAALQKWGGRAGAADDFTYALLCLAMLWYSPQVMSYYLALLLLPVGLVVGHAYCERLAGRRDRLAEVTLACYILLCMTVASPHLRALGSYQWIVALLGAFVLWRAVSMRRSEVIPAGVSQSSAQAICRYHRT